MNSEFYLAAGTTGADGYEVEVTPNSAGWGYTSLRIVRIGAGEPFRFSTGDDEVIVVPLSGSATVEAGGARFCSLVGRQNVFAGPTDVAYLTSGSTVELRSQTGGRFALCGARVAGTAVHEGADQPERPRSRYLAVTEVPVELRGAGQSSRQVRNFGTPDTLSASKIIACEVITPAGNWSSYPAHKHDETTETESDLEEIYYFEIAAGPHGQPGFGFMRTSSSPGHHIDLLEEVADGDLVLVPYGWHGPCVAAPGFDMYYLNVMAGPGAERAWKISDHPDQAWVRGTWQHLDLDPRLTAKDA